MDQIQKRFVITGFVSGLIFITSVLPTYAGWVRNRGYNGLDKGYVIAESHFGNGSVIGAVRKSSKGLQVRTPGGNWIYCRASCSETLRAETVDQWENQGEMIGIGTASLECGIFGCLNLSSRFRD